MSFFQRWIRPFFTRQEVAPPDSHENDSKPVEVKVKVEEESDSESVIFVRENPVLKDDANLRDDTNLEDNICFQDDADLNLESNPEDDVNPQADATQDDSAPNGSRSSPRSYVSPYSTNVSSIDDQRTRHKSEAERRYFDSLFCESESSSEDDAGKKDEDNIAVIPRGRSFSPLFVEQRESSAQLIENDTPSPSSTSQPPTPAPPPTSVSTDVMNISPTATTSEVPANAITAKSAVLSINQLLFDQAQVADQPRLSWNWSHGSTKTREHYEPTAVGKWWWVWAQENRESLPLISNLGRIMETELGEQRFGANRCTRCQIEDLECWNYSQRAVHQVSNPGSACTRCRTDPKTMGCSLSRRTPKKRWTRPPTPPAPRLLLPKVGHGVYQYPPVHMGPAVQAGNPRQTSK